MAALEQTLAIIKPDAIQAGRADDILRLLRENMFTIIKQELVQLRQEQAAEFFCDEEDSPQFAELTQFMCGAPCMLLCLTRRNAIKTLQELAGPCDPNEAKTKAPNSVRAVFGTDKIRNALHASDNPANARREIRFFFPRLLVEYISTGSSARKFLNEQVVSTLTTGLTELCRQRPDDAIAWLGNWLLENNPNNPATDAPLKFLSEEDAKPSAGATATDAADSESQPQPPRAPPSDGPSRPSSGRKLKADEVDAASEAASRPATSGSAAGSVSGEPSSAAAAPDAASQSGEKPGEDTPAIGRVVFVLGGPGAGKGTQCQKLVDTYGFKHLSAGDLLRAEAASGSEQGQMLSDLMKEGKIVPGHITIGLLRAAMMKQPDAVYLIDGFPREMQQALDFENDVRKCEFVLFFDCPEEVMEKRLLQRGETSGRADDNIETIKKRFRTFVETSMPVIEHFESDGRVRKIIADRDMDAIFEETVGILKTGGLIE